MTPDGFLFELTGGNVALDLANTIVDRPVNDRELLRSYDDLLSWSEQSHLIDAAKARALRKEAAAHPVAAKRAFRLAIEIRETIFRAFSTPNTDEATLRALEEYERTALQHRRLVQQGERTVREWTNSGLDQMLWPVVHAAVTLLTSDERARVRTCQGEICLWLFIDNSRQGNRRWCDMTTCGNRAKAKRHYSKLAESKK